MTRKEALRKIKGYLTDIIPQEDYAEVEEIVKALEQEPCPYWDYGLKTCRHANVGALATVTPNEVLEKIKAEIEQITDTMGVSYNQYVSKIDVLAIIDKYKADKE